MGRARSWTLTSVAVVIAAGPVDPPPRGPDAALETSRALTAATDAARWLETHAVTVESGLVWPRTVEAPEAGSFDLYAGSAGPTLFLLELGRVTQDRRWLDLGRAGADALAAIDDPDEPAGLWVGTAGRMLVLTRAADTTGERRYDDVARSLSRRLTGAIDDTRPAWNDSLDLISGSAGIGLALLEAHRRWGDDTALRCAITAADDLIANARPGETPTTLRWTITRARRREMPNLSHGTAGVVLFLTRLARRLAPEEPAAAARFREAAIAGARYLETVATPVGDGALLCHEIEGGRDRFYLGWCHGPTGTVRALRELAILTDDQRWTRFGDRLIAGLVGAGAPIARSKGYWNNHGACCGTAGVSVFLASCTFEAAYERAACGLAEVIERGQRTESGLAWTHAEHRVRPDLLQTQTGLMQGAAGIGLALLRFAERREGATPSELIPGGPF